MRELVLENKLSPGDVVVCSAAIRDLHRAHPGEFKTEYRGVAPQVFEHNPNITVVDKSKSEHIVLEYPLIHKSNTAPVHFIEAYHQFLEEVLGVEIPITEFKPDIHISDLEKTWINQVHEIVGQDIPFWIIVAGGKFDFTNKWWDHERYQEVVDELRGRVLFVQVGEAGHHHKPLNGVIDLVGKTDFRQLIRLVHHARGVICPVTCMMHLAAGVETRYDAFPIRPCVVVAGGREPVSWEHYPWHAYLHTQGMLDCCANGGCWKSRVTPLSDGDPKNKSLCLKPVDIAENIKLPRCMDMITAEDVIRKVEDYLVEAAPVLTEEQFALSEPHLSSV